MSSFNEEEVKGKRIYSDIWANDDDMLETLVLVTKDEALHRVLAGFTVRP